MSQLDMKELLQLIRGDNNYFIGAGRSLKRSFNYNNPTTSEEHELRWHYNSGELFAMIIEKMAEYEQEKELFKKRRDEFTSYITEVAKKEAEMARESIALNAKLDSISDQILALTDASNTCVISCGDLRTSFLNRMDLILDEINEIRGVNGPQIHTIQDKEPVVRLKLPSFSAEEHERPLFYLKELKDYLRVNKIKDEDVMTVIAQTLNKKSKSWFVSVQNVKSLEEFETVFRQRFWNEPIKNQLRAKVEGGKWSKGKKSRVEYAEWMITSIRELELEIPEQEMVIKIARQFDDATQLAFRMQNVNDTGKLYDFLTELDKLDPSNQGQQQKPGQDGNNFRKSFFKSKFKISDEKSEQNQCQTRNQGGNSQNQNQNNSQTNGNFNQQKGNSTQKMNFIQKPNSFNNNGSQNQPRNSNNQNFNSNGQVSNSNTQNFGQNLNGQNNQNRPYRKPYNGNNESSISALQFQQFYEGAMKALNEQPKNSQLPVNPGNE